jgi:hypothetical protein
MSSHRVFIQLAPLNTLRLLQRFDMHFDHGIWNLPHLMDRHEMEPLWPWLLQGL